jgi:hypothetical protein
LEIFDVAIVGGGSAGLAALKKLSDLGKQVVLKSQKIKRSTMWKTSTELISKNRLLWSGALLNMSYTRLLEIEFLVLI